MINAILASAPGAFVTFWPSVVAIVVVAIAGLWTAAAFARRRKFVTCIAISLAGLAGLAIALHDGANPANNILTRDLVAFVFLALATPTVAALTARSLEHASPVPRLVASVTIGFAIVSISPVLLLLVHCTSGDCL